MGDTLTHLASMNEVEELVKKVQTNLVKGGKLVLSFRDLSIPLGGTNRFIPVKSDDTRIHTCFLEYFETHVQVYDLLYEKQNDKWVQKVSSYPKLILTPSLLYSYLESADLQTVLRRLEKKEYLKSKFGEATKVRGGKRKRFFSITAYGKKILTEAKEQRNNLWNAVPEFSLNK